MDAQKVNGQESRVVALCVDAMSLDFVREHSAHLPCFKRLLADGATRTLSSSSDPLTASIWATFATGEGPGAHGHYYPFQWDADAMRFERTSSAGMRRRLHVEPFWYDLAHRNVPTIAFDPGTSNDASLAPHTEIINWCYQSTGHASSATPDLLRELRRRYGHRPIGKEVPVPKTLQHSRAIRDSLIKAIDLKSEATLWLMNREPWRFFLAGFYEVHRAGHNLLVVEGDYGSHADPDALLEVYQAQDRALQRIIAHTDDGNTTFALFSLHGMVPNWSQEHFLDAIMDRLNEAWIVGRGGEPRPERKPNPMSQLRGLIPARAQYALAYLLGEQVQDWVVNYGIVGGRNWRRTPAFRFASGGEGYLRLNLKGRERDGCLEQSDVADYVAWLKAKLLEIKVDGTNAPFIRDVVETTVICRGERTSYLPDLVIDYAPDEPVVAIQSPVIGRLTAQLETGRGGNHSDDAFLIVIGPGSKHPALGEIDDIRDIRTYIETLLITPEDGCRTAPGKPGIASPLLADA